MDYFELDGKVIYYSINTELMHCKYDKYGELIKAQRMILFFDNFGNVIGSGPYHDIIDKATSISRQSAIEVYKQYVQKKGEQDGAY